MSEEQLLHNVSGSPEDSRLTSGMPSHGDQLLLLRSALNEKDLELVELREQHIRLVERSAEARANWEEAVASKDLAIDQLQEALRAKEHALQRLERNHGEATQRLLEEREQQEAALQAERRRLVALSAAHEEQSEHVAGLERMLKLQGKELEAGNPAAVEAAERRAAQLQDAMREKEQVIEGLEVQLKEAKAQVWEREKDLAQQQLSQQKLQATIGKKQAAVEVVEAQKEQLKAEKLRVEQVAERLKEEMAAQQTASLQASQSKAMMAQQIQTRVSELQAQMTELQEGVASKEALLQRQREQNHGLHAALEEMSAVHDKLAQEHKKLVESHGKCGSEQERLRLEAGQFRARIEELEKEVKTVQRQAAAADQTQQLEAVSAELRQSRRNAEQLAADLALERTSRAAELQREVQREEKRLRQQMREAKAVADARIAELEGEVHRERMRATTAQGAFQQLVGDGREYRELEKKLEGLEEAIRAKELAWKRTEAALQAELERRSMQLGETERVQEQLESVVRRLASRLPGSDAKGIT